MASTSDFLERQGNNDWYPQSWRLKTINAQGVDYPDRNALEKVCCGLHALPPLVSPGQVERARESFAKAAKGERFIMQGGDCAESFEDVRLDIIESKASLLAQQANLIESNLLLPVTCIGRIAGQYAKPRSSATETLVDGTTVPAFRGHNVNGIALDQRTPDPERLLHGYLYSAATLNTLSVIGCQQKSAESTCGASPITNSSTRESPLVKSNLSSREIFTSHEALHLPYESSLTRGRYCTSAAFLWVGERTRQLDGAHIEFVRGLRNPIGIKVSARTAPTELVALLDRLCPLKSSDPGRITLITRLGAQNVHSALPVLIQAVQCSGHWPVWICDPCHGNTITAKEEKIKTRCAVTMLDEVQQTYAIHRSNGSRLDGLHIEQTGESVIECVEHVAVGTGDLSLGVNYRTLCDPRLSQEQAVLLVKRFTEFVQNFELERKLRGEVDAGKERIDLALPYNIQTIRDGGTLNEGK